MRNDRRWGDNPRPGIDPHTLDRLVLVACGSILGILLALLFLEVL